MSCGRSKPSGDSPKAVYQQAFKAFREGALEEANARLEPLRPLWQEGVNREAADLRLLKAEVLLAQAQYDQAALLLAKNVPDEADLRVRQSMDWADELWKLGRNQAAFLVLDEAEKTAARYDLKAPSGPIIAMRGTFYARLGEYDRAEELLREALRRAGERNDDYDASMALINLSYCFLKRGRYDEAIRYGELTAAAAERARAQRVLGAAWGNMSACFTQLGDFDRALDLRKKAIAIQERMKDPLLLQQSMGEMGNLQLMLDSPRQAADYFLRGYELAQSTPGMGDTSKWAGNLAQTYLQAGSLAEAERWNEEARKLKVAAGDDKTLAYVELTAAEILAGRGKKEEAEQRLEKVIRSAEGNAGLQWSAHAAMGNLYSHAREFDNADRHFQEALKIIDTRRKEFARSEYQLTFLSRLIGSYQEYVDALMARGDGRRALLVAESSRARILKEKLGQKDAPASSSMEEFQNASRRTGSTLLAYWVAPRRSWVWVVKPDAVQWFELPGRDELDRLARAYRETVEKNGRDPLAEDAGRKLAQVMLGPVRPLLGRAPSVIVVPDGPLNRVNMETLPVEGRYWLEEATVSVAPSLSVLAASRQKEPRAPLSLLAVGDPEETDARYGKLKFARQELESVARQTRGAEVLAGAKATPAAYVEAKPERFRLIHFAAHAEANAQNPLDSAIILSADKDRHRLLVSDVLKHPLQADLVTVSACRSAGVRAYSGEGLVGFAWGFLQTGAKAVIADLWNVNDESTAALMTAMYAGLAAGKPAAVALRDSKLSLLRGREEWRRPFYWAPFQIYVR